MKSRTKMILACAGVAAVLLFGVVYSLGVRSSQSKAIAKAHAHQVDSAAKLTSLQAQKRALLLAQARIPAVEAQLAALKLALPGQAALPQVIDDIRQVSLASGVNLTDLSQTAATPTKASAGTGTTAASALQVVTLGITAGGTYPQLMNYVTKLNLLPRTVAVDGLTVGVALDGKMTIKITGRMFYVPTGS